ncbi:Putative NADPH-quinone reductase (modulator of drug activity B) [Paenibacillus sp. UNCCL117]|uniref:NAD(P)H-dependent oxidoreductase n=1 Tax=unclassified Paenibacillus TaxID=185978 RepID=UPI000889C3AB|nr:MULTISPECIES: NAD(P)H-dependent oxidoreductase [unclassified Paenibacillus]SDD15205.1 Putative NADPH-quinone reductase (modulator of drug activity B) [Paenibacillus sp. cl123]SFW34392.1 Putative NADPH-quinone reductase (modulator of drug activity B) [Paenibacillus sp. UNCCL117]
MKTLVIVTHPSIETSTINRRLVAELNKFPAKYTVHDLHKTYPDGNIDAMSEQRLVESHGNLVLQFPVFWFNCPPLLKKWLDEVLTYGWGYGSGNGNQMKNRKVALAVSTGISRKEYSPDGKYKYALTQLLAPFETTFHYCHSDYRSFFAVYGKEGDDVSTVEDNRPTTDVLDESAHEYLRFIDAM